MKEYQKFVDKLKKINEEHPISLDNSQWKDVAVRAIDGLAGEELRNLVPLDVRRNNGAFFTSTELGQEVFQSYKLKFKDKIYLYDPACGAGNLLISARKHYIKQVPNKVNNIELLGTDIHREFIDAAQLRLSIYDLLEYKQPKGSYLKNFLIKDGFEDNQFYKLATHIVTNPPFNLIKASRKINWATGKVSAAALFIDSIIEHVKIGTQIIAILPDVLRCGTRYEKWREHISNNCEISNVKLLGQFDKYADVDVFSVMLTKRDLSTQNSQHNWNERKKSISTVNDLFNVSVGSVVDNRDLHEGSLRPYLISRGLSGWSTVTRVDRTRQYKGKSVESPFVVVKRTSRHGDSHRAIASIVNISEPVYVDNHLIILKPVSGKLADCKKLMKSLKNTNTDKWIDEQIRCRHLTVKIVSNIPLYE